MTMSRFFLLTLLFTVLLTFDGVVAAKVLTVREVNHVRKRERIIVKPELWESFEIGKRGLTYLHFFGFPISVIKSYQTGRSECAS